MTKDEVQLYQCFMDTAEKFFLNISKLGFASTLGIKLSAVNGHRRFTCDTKGLTIVENSGDGTREAVFMTSEDTLVDNGFKF